MAETSPANQFSLDRRQLLASVGAATAARIVPVVDSVGDVQSAELVEVPEVSVLLPEMQT